MTLLSGDKMLAWTMRWKSITAQAPNGRQSLRPIAHLKPNATSIKCGIFRERAKMSAQAKRAVRGHVSSSGRLSLPAEFRKAIGLERGGNVIVELDGNDIRIRTINEAVARAQAIARRLFADKPGVS